MRFWFVPFWFAFVLSVCVLVFVFPCLLVCLDSLFGLFVFVWCLYLYFFCRFVCWVLFRCYFALFGFVLVCDFVCVWFVWLLFMFGLLCVFVSVLLIWFDFAVLFCLILIALRLIVFRWLLFIWLFIYLVLVFVFIVVSFATGVVDGLFVFAVCLGVCVWCFYCC